MLNHVLHFGALASTLAGSHIVAVSRTSDDRCPPAALRVANALMTADTLGVGVSAASRDSSGIDTLTTERFEGAPDVAHIVLSYQLTCLLAARDSVILRVMSRHVGRIEPDRDHEAFHPDTAPTLGYMEFVRRGSHWKLKGPFAAVDLSPAAALRRFKDSLDADSRKALARLAARHR